MKRLSSLFLAADAGGSTGNQKPPTVPELVARVAELEKQTASHADAMKVAKDEHASVQTALVKERDDAKQALAAEKEARQKAEKDAQDAQAAVTTATTAKETAERQALADRTEAAQLREFAARHGVSMPKTKSGPEGAAGSTQQPKTILRADFDKMTPAEKKKFVLGGGQITDPA